MKEKNMYSLLEISEILNKSRSWANQVYRKQNIIPAKIVTSMRGRKKLLFSVEQLQDFRNYIERPYVPKVRENTKLQSPSSSEDKKTIKELNEKIEKLKEEKFMLNYKLEKERYWQLRLDMRASICDCLGYDLDDNSINYCVNEILETFGFYVFRNYSVNLTEYKDKKENPELKELEE